MQALCRTRQEVGRGRLGPRTLGSNKPQGKWLMGVVEMSWLWELKELRVPQMQQGQELSGA